MNDLFNKKECSEYEYLKNKELFDIAIKSGLISTPERFEKSRISTGSISDSQYWYRWRLL